MRRETAESLFRLFMSTGVAGVALLIGALVASRVGGPDLAVVAATVLTLTAVAGLSGLVGRGYDDA